jgi:hypothetical protein
MALMATLGSTRSGMARRRIAAALEASQRRSRESLVAVLAHISQVVGLRLRDPAYTLDHVQLAGGLLVQSMALRNVQVQAAMGTADAVLDGAGLNGALAGSDSLDGAADTAMVNGLASVRPRPIPGPGRARGR